MSLKDLFLELSSPLAGSAIYVERHSQVGSLAGAAHLLNDNAGVLRVSSMRTEISCRTKG